MFSLAALLIVIAAVAGSTVVMGIIAYFLHRIRRVEGRTFGDAGQDQLLDQIREIRDDLIRLEDEMSALSERVDFTDKLLMSGDASTGRTRPE
jgi:hypothetical protein